MALAVGMQRVAGFGDGSLEADRGQSVLQRAALALMHVDVACGDDGEAQGSADGDQFFAAGGVVGVEETLCGDPQVAAKARGEPAGFVLVRLMPGNPQRKATFDAVGEVGARQPIAALLRAAPAAGNER